MLNELFFTAFEKWELNEGNRVSRNADSFSFFKEDLLEGLSSVVESLGYNKNKDFDYGVGKGFWVQNPWVSIRDEQVSTSPEIGVYIVYLFSPNGNCVYLTLNQGAEHKSMSELRESSESFREKIEKPMNFEVGLGGDILGESADNTIQPTQRARKWTEGTIYSIKYTKDSIPDDVQLKSDLNLILESYEKFIDNGKMINLESDLNIWQISPGYHRNNFWPEFSESNIIAIGWDELGDLNQYEGNSEIENALRTYYPRRYPPERNPLNDINSCWYFSKVIKLGDIIVAKYGHQKKVYGIGKVIKEYYYDYDREYYKNVIGVNWIIKFDEPIEVDISSRFVQWTVNSLYLEKFNQLKASILKDYPEYEDKFNELIIKSQKMYVPEQKDVKPDLNLYDSSFIEELENLLISKRQIILQGPPGTSKTHLAIELAKKIERANPKLIQFHPTYSYENFVEGLTVKAKGQFEPTPKIFLRKCQEARDNPDKQIFLIIDEINRGLLGKIFGELIIGLEYRESQQFELPYSEKSISIPPNLMLIGTMNTADRSIALVDYALRRRFFFVDMMPNEAILRGWLDINSNLSSPEKEKVVSLFSNINEIVKNDPSLGDNFQIGHTYYFIENIDKISIQWKYAIRPLLKEYFFGDNTKLVVYDELWQQFIESSEE